MDMGVLNEFNGVVLRLYEKIKAKQEQKDTKDTITEEKD